MESNVDIKSASNSLHSYLSNYSWLTMIGVGRNDDVDCIYAYVKKLGATEKSVIPSEWEGFKVIPRKIGSLKTLLH